MKKLKKILTSVLAFVFMFVGAISLWGCGSKKTPSMTFSYVAHERELINSNSDWRCYVEVNVNNSTGEDIVIYQNNFNVEACYEFKNEKIYHNFAIVAIYTTYTEGTSLSNSYRNEIDKSLQVNSNTQQTIYLKFMPSASRTVYYSDTTTYYNLKTITISYLGDIIVKDLPIGK